MTGKILVVDDEPDVQTYLTTLFQDNGYDTVSAEDGVKGLAMAKSEKPDLITLDVMMPPPDGWELLQRLRNQAELVAQEVAAAQARFDAERQAVREAEQRLAHARRAAGQMREHLPRLLQAAHPRVVDEEWDRSQKAWARSEALLRSLEPHRGVEHYLANLTEATALYQESHARARSTLVRLLRYAFLEDPDGMHEAIAVAELHLVLLDGALPHFRSGVFPANPDDHECEERNQQPPQGLLQVAIAALLADQQVELQVAIIEGLHVAALHGGAHVRGQLVQVGEVRFPLRHKAGGEALHDGAELIDLNDILLAQEDDASRASGVPFEKAFGDQRTDGLADGRLGDAKAL